MFIHKGHRLILKHVSSESTFLSKVTSEQECITVTKNGYYKLQSCNDSTAEVVCQYPGTCPRPYSEHRGLCYRVIVAGGVTDLLSAQSECSKDGASLAYPEDLDTPLSLFSLRSLSSIIVESCLNINHSIILSRLFFLFCNFAPNFTFFSLAPRIVSSIMISLVILQMRIVHYHSHFFFFRNSSGNWTFNGLYSPSNDVITMAGTSPSPSQLWRFLVVPALASDPLNLLPAALKSDNVTVAVCQLYGPINCLYLPPEPTVNMTRVWNSGAKTINKNDYYFFKFFRCHLGYFVGGNTSVTQQNISCIGVLGDWYPQLKDCLAVEVCTEPLSQAAKTLENATDDNFRFFNGTASFFCPEDMATAERNTTQTIICSFNGTGYAFDPPVILPCNACIAEPQVNKSHVQWTNSTVWTIGAAVVADCLPGHMLNVSSNTQNVLCTETGWEVKKGCYKGGKNIVSKSAFKTSLIGRCLAEATDFLNHLDAACDYDPPEAGSNMVRSDYASNSVGTVLVYNCTDGYFVPPTEIDTEPVTWTNVTCSPNKTWIPENNYSPYCARLCLDDPIDPTLPLINSTWNGIDREIGSQVVISCPTEYYFTNMNQTLVITCEEGGLWTNYSSGLLICRKRKFCATQSYL
ncbi:uncharacterized protein [Macrobrachium rosenbergii]|uniref:uncharacterized protein n=1 Tax=Macrobrachium rosenbergii TaxID=79674 RepID=UPI0034D47484